MFFFRESLTTLALDTFSERVRGREIGPPLKTERFLQSLSCLIWVIVKCFKDNRGDIVWWHCVVTLSGDIVWWHFVVQEVLSRCLTSWWSCTTCTSRNSTQGEPLRSKSNRIKVNSISISIKYSSWKSQLAIAHQLGVHWGTWDWRRVFPKYFQNISKIFPKYFQNISKIFPKYLQNICRQNEKEANFLSELNTMLRVGRNFSNDQHSKLLQIIYFSIQGVLQIFLSSNNTFLPHHFCFGVCWNNGLFKKKETTLSGCSPFPFRFEVPAKTNMLPEPIGKEGNFLQFQQKRARNCKIWDF